MRTTTLTFISLLGTMGLAASALAQQPPQQEQEQQQQPQLQEQQGPIAEVQVIAPFDERYRLAPQRMTEVKGDYSMSQGQWLNVGIVGRKLVAELNERGRVELVQIGANKFAAKGQPMTLVFYQGRDNDAIEVTYVPDEALGAPSPTYVTMAFNR